RIEFLSRLQFETVTGAKRLSAEKRISPWFVRAMAPVRAILPQPCASGGNRAGQSRQKPIAEFHGRGLLITGPNNTPPRFETTSAHRIRLSTLRGSTAGAVSAGHDVPGAASNREPGRWRRTSRRWRPESRWGFRGIPSSAYLRESHTVVRSGPLHPSRGR